MIRDLLGVSLSGRLDGLSLRSSGLARGPRVDRESGRISGVPIAETGLVHPANAEPFYLDDRALAAMMDAINNADPRIKVRVTHPSLEGRDGVARTVGVVENAALVGGRLVGTIRLGSYAMHTELGDMRSYLLAIAGEDPGSIGLSVVFGAGELVDAEGLDYPVARPQSLLAVDVVGEPAANAAGMLSRAPAAALGSSVNPAARTDAPMFTQAQIEYLRGLGLPEGATDQEVADFIDGLNAEQLAGFEAVEASGGEEADAPAASDAEPASREPVGAAASRGRPLGFYETVADRNREAGAQAERNRVRALGDIATAARMPRAWLSTAIAEGWTVDRARNNAASSRTAPAAPAPPVRVGVNRERAHLAQAISDAILLRAGHRVGDIGRDDRGVATFTSRAPDRRANEFRSLSLLEIGRRFLEATGVRTSGMSRVELAQALTIRRAQNRRLDGASLTLDAAIAAEVGATSDFPLILGNTLNKALMTAYTTAPRLWRKFCGMRTVPDYKGIKSVQLGDADLEVVAEGDDFPFVKLTESGESWQLGVYGKGVAFTRIALVNDDLSAFERVPNKLGFAAAQLEDALAFAQLQSSTMGDTKALYHADHNNLEATDVGPPTLNLLSKGIAAVRAQTADGSMAPLDFPPNLVIVPATLDGVARQLVYGAVDPAGTLGANPYQGELEVVSSARLTGDAWYMACRPGELIDTIELAFLDGETEPQVGEDEDFTSETMLWKVRHSCAAKALDWRGLWKNVGG